MPISTNVPPVFYLNKLKIFRHVAQPEVLSVFFQSKPDTSDVSKTAPLIFRNLTKFVEVVILPGGHSLAFYIDDKTKI